jgi:hypothetical protein
MRWFASIFLAALAAGAAEPALEVVQPTVSQSDGGTPLPPGFNHVPGAVLFFTFQVSGYQKDAESKVHLTYTVDALDPHGVRIEETIKNEVTAELTPHDKDWKPKVRTEISLPPLGDSGTYKIVVKVRDEIAKTSAEKTLPVEVSGHEVEPSDTLTVRNFRFFRGEDDAEPLAKPIYRPGDPVWARFDIRGYKYGKNNAVDVTYGISVITASGKVLWSQAEAAVERTESFYPKRYVPGAMSINLQPNIRPGEYTIAVQAKDAVGNQTYEGKYTFTVE